MLASRNAYRRGRDGKWIRLSVDAVNNSSQYHLLVRCDECQVLFRTKLANRNKRLREGRIDFCLSCCRKGDRNPQYGKERAGLMAFALTFRQRKPMLGQHHSEDSKSKMSAIKARQIAAGEFDILSNNRGRKQWHVSIKNNEPFHADSLLELMRMIQLDNDALIVSWTKRHGIKIPYQSGESRRFCVPDFLIVYANGSTVMEEVKGRITAIEATKIAAMKEWCVRKGIEFRLVTQAQMNINGEYRRFIKGRTV